MRCGWFLNATRGSVQTQLQFVEGKCAANRKSSVRSQERTVAAATRHVVDDIGKIARERLTIL
jgi:hypothetical protein